MPCIERREGVIEKLSLAMDTIIGRIYISDCQKKVEGEIVLKLGIGDCFSP